MVAETSEASKSKVLPVKTTRARARVAKSAEHVHVQNLQFDQCRKSDFSA